MLQGAPKPLEYLGTAFLSRGWGMPQLFKKEENSQIVLVLTLRFHSLAKLELTNCILLNLGYLSVVSWEPFFVAISQINSLALQNYKKLSL